MIAFYTFSFGRKGYPFLELHATQERGTPFFRNRKSKKKYISN